ncbi:MAG TPA: zf-HC2 domain-containing protein [Acidimicrobiales bacterium]|nr:zf-HC2 domain-containing protein [Acidimicrobiales bacterium]
MSAETACEAFSDDLALLALGTLSGRDRAMVLQHLEGCASCSDEVEQLSLAADALLPLAPEVNPPAGFEVRVFERMGIDVPSRGRPSLSRHRRVLLGVAAAAVAFGGAFGVGLWVDRSPVPAPTPSTVARLFEADLTSATHYRGELYLAQGQPGWLFMTVHNAGASGYVTCQLVTDSGAHIKIGTFWLSAGAANWASALPVPAGRVRMARLVASDGTVLASATVKV